MKEPSQLKDVRFFESALLDFFKKAGREHLPWRREGISAYEVWVSEVMLQQTQVSRVVPFYGKFLKRFPTVDILARTSWEEFLPYYDGLGYYIRGRNMLRTAKMVVEMYGGEFPNDTDALRRLPGIGAYTACAIASFAYGEDEIAWDTNVRRVIGRFFFGTKDADGWRLAVGRRKSGGEGIGKPGAGNIARCAGIEVRASEVVARAFSLPAKTLNAAFMDFGSAICTGKPKCATCPFAARCRFFRERGKREYGWERVHSGGQQTASNRKTGNRESFDGSERIDWKSARVEVTLHENHRKYFSSVKTRYKPFLVPASHNTRAGIKLWFRERYGLDVAVRPPNGKRVIQSVPTLLVNAQILSGVHDFAVFSKNA